MRRLQICLSEILFINALLAFSLFPIPVGAQDVAAPDESESITQGVYWWSDRDLDSIGSFPGFGVEQVAIRAGVAGFTGAGGTAGIDWIENIPDLSGCPDGLSYRAVIETRQSFWTSGTGESIGNFLLSSAIPLLGESDLQFIQVELRLPEQPDTIPPGILEKYLEAAGHVSATIPVSLGINARKIPSLTSTQIELLKNSTNQIVVYFTGYDYTGASPKIADQAWIESTIGLIEASGISYRIVLPVYNQAILYRSGDMTRSEIIPSIDLTLLAENSDIREMGTAGTEFTITNARGLGSPGFNNGDKIRLLQSTKQIDLKTIIGEIPGLGPNCDGIDLFRFPLVPGFDPPAADVLAVSGWIATPVMDSALEIPDAEKEAMDKKYNSAQQIIWMVTLGLMTVLLMRMFSKGKASAQQGSGESK